MDDVDDARRHARLDQQLDEALAERGVSVAGLKTTVLPQTSAGTIFQDGIAIGKFQGVITPTTPIGMRTLMLNLSRSSDGRRLAEEAPALAGHVVAHVDRFLDVAAGLGEHLPHLVRHQVGAARPCARGGARAKRKRISPRSGAGTSRQSSYAAFAAATARSTSAGRERGKTPITSPVAGLVVSNVSPADGVDPLAADEVLEGLRPVGHAAILVGLAQAAGGSLSAPLVTTV